MAVINHLYALLGLDVGGVNTHVCILGNAEGKYSLLGSENAPTSFGQDMHIGAGVGQAMESLQQRGDHLFLKESGGLLMPVDRIGRGVDRVGMVISAGPRVRAAMLGLSAQGSLKAAKALSDSLPMRSVTKLDLAQLTDEIRAIETLIKAHPELILITGGEDNGAEEPVRQWLEVVRTACKLWPSTLQPVIIYAGNPSLKETVKRRLESVAKLLFTPNLQPAYGEYDLVQAQILLEKEILHQWKDAMPGLGSLAELTDGLFGLTVQSSERMIRFLNQSKRHSVSSASETGILAVDLGGIYTTVSAGLSGQAGSVILDKFPDLEDPMRLDASQAIFDWVGESVTLEEVDQFFCNHILRPSWVPESNRALNFSLAFVRYRLCQALKCFSKNYSWLDYHPERGLQGHFEPIIISGSVLTKAPNPQGVMLALLDGLQPWGITTLVLDRHHLLPLLGKVGEVEPILPVHLLASPAYENLGTVVSVVGSVPKGRTALTIHVETESGGNFSVDIPQGKLKRLDIPAGKAAVLELVPHRKVDIGFGGEGRGGRLKVIGGALGVVVDARGRPLSLPDKGERRIELLQQWLQDLGADHV